VPVIPRVKRHSCQFFPGLNTEITMKTFFGGDLPEFVEFFRKFFTLSASHITIIGTILPWKNFKKSKF
jgi:hypothetical protein